jgi:transcriptional regulator with XRE-family HTH domain
MKRTVPVSTDNPVNARIRELRHALKLSQVNFAKAIHVSNGYLAEIELGHTAAHDRIVALIAAAFSVDEHWLRTGSGDIFKPPPGKCQSPAQKMVRMTALFNDLYPEFQDYILEQIERLVALQHVRHDS